MDWTGGSKRRFAIHGKEGILQRQRAHFTKARSTAQKLTGSQKSPRTDKVLKRKAHRSPASRCERKRKVPSLNHKHDTYVQTTNIPAAHLNAAPSLSRGLVETRTRDYSKDCHGPKRMWASTPVDAVRSTNSQRNTHSNIRDYNACADQSDAKGGQHQTLADGPTYQKTTQSKQESPIVISSNSSAESLASELSLVLPRTEGRNAAGDVRPTPLTEKQRLLARPDWLGLEATRPLQIYFQPDEDKSRIGKRRKLDQSSKKDSKGTRCHNAISHVHHSCLRDGWDRDDLKPSDILIKIGSEALSSQSQTHNTAPHHRTQPTSIRPMSVDSQYLSEESMLLEAGEDLPIFANFDLGASLVHGLAQSSVLTQHDLASSLFKSPSANEEDTEHDGELFRVSDSRGSPAAMHNSEIVNNRLYQSRLEGSVRSSEIDSIKQQEVDATACEKGWRAHLGVQARSSSKESMKVLRSSGGCTTSSEKIHHMAASGKAVAVPEDLERVAPSEIHGVSHRQAWQDPASNVAVASSTSSPASEPSPSGSFALIRNLIRAPTRKRSSLPQAQDDDVIWRDFIIGSQSSDSEP